MTTVELYVLSRPWIPVLLWVALYTGDYYLTLLGARLYERQSIMRFKGSYELTPSYQKDVDSQRRVSPRFLRNLLIGAAMLLVIPLALPDFPAYVYGFIVGGMIVPEAFVHVRHIANIMLFRRLASPNPGAEGSVLMSKENTYSQSAWQFASHAGVCLLLFALTNSPILLGGAVELAVCAQRHRKLAAKSRAAEARQSAEAQEAAAAGED